jgi:hypothetical protein
VARPLPGIDPQSFIPQSATVAYPGIMFGVGGGVQLIQLRTEGRENGDLGAVAP